MGYGVRFCSCSLFSFPGFDRVKNVVIFRVDNSSSVYIVNKKKDTLVLGEGLTQQLNDTMIIAEANILLILQDHKQNFP